MLPRTLDDKNEKQPKIRQNHEKVIRTPNQTKFFQNKKKPKISMEAIRRNSPQRP
jgi:hypothetical protein